MLLGISRELLESHSHSRSIDVSISCFDRLDNGVFLGAFILPGAESNGWDFGSGVQLASGGHFETKLLW